MLAAAQYTRVFCKCCFQEASREAEGREGGGRSIEGFDIWTGGYAMLKHHHNRFEQSTTAEVFLIYGHGGFYPRYFCFLKLVHLDYICRCGCVKTPHAVLKLTYL